MTKIKHFKKTSEISRFQKTLFHFCFVTSSYRIMKKTLELYITKACNLGCDYCFVDINNPEKTHFDVRAFLEKNTLEDYNQMKFFWWEPLLRWKELVETIESVRKIDSSMKFTIVTNGLLFDEEKTRFIAKNNISVVVSIHKKGLEALIRKLPILRPIWSFISFNFIFQPDDITFPYSIFSKLTSFGFENFIFTPDIYSVWNTENITLLSRELDRPLLAKKTNPKLYIGDLTGESLRPIFAGCEKKVIDPEWKSQVCNRFKATSKYPDITYERIYDTVDAIIWLRSNPDRWFYSCPIWQFFDCLLTHGENPEAFKDWFLNYDALSKVFIEFFRQIATLEWKTNFLTKNIDEIRFNLTNQCNLHCEYCYVDKEKKWSLDIDVAKNILDFHISQPWETKILSFFGGEPLLEYWLLKEMVLYANSLAKKHTKKIQYKIATNFLLANDEKISFLKQNNFEVHVSLNGTPETNDMMRSTSTKTVLANLSRYQETIGKENITILLAFSWEEVSSLFANAYFIYSQGFKKINLEMIFGKRYLWTGENFITLKKELTKIAAFQKIEVENIHSQMNPKNIVDISIEGKADGNSFWFNEYSLELKYKRVFDALIRDIFWLSWKNMV